MRRLFLGIDVSTTGAKALLIDEKGAVVATVTTPLTLQTPKPLWSEQDPGEWGAGAATHTRTALAAAGAEGGEVGGRWRLTGHIPALVLFDADRKVLRPAILWNDQRTGAECEEIHRRVGTAELIREAGTAALTGFTAPKILWVRKHEPEVYRRARLVLLPKDYVRLRLTGEAAMGKADGSGPVLRRLPPGRRVAASRHLGVRLRDHRRAARGARRPAPRLLPRRARQVALHGRHARGRRQPAVVPRHAPRPPAPRRGRFP